MRSKATIVQMPDLHLVVVRAERDRVPEIRAAWRTLESSLSSLKGRKFYGVCCNEESGTVYYAGVEPLSAKESELPGFSTMDVKGGKYARAKLSNWHEHADEIGAIVDELQKEFATDRSRPVIEYYRSHSELHLLAPLAE